MMKSMTAYARAEKTADEINISTEIRSYNSRYLDVSLRILHGFNVLEEKIKALIIEKVARGRIEMSLKINDGSDEAYSFEINIPKAKDLLVREGGVIRSVEIDRDMDAVWPVVRDCVDEALNNLVEMRKKEGAFIALDITGRISRIE
jgi:uncharacterized protein YicC (UPF0701 family)